MASILHAVASFLLRLRMDFQPDCVHVFADLSGPARPGALYLQGSVVARGR
jgi:hypothetical protein